SPRRISSGRDSRRMPARTDKAPLRHAERRRDSSEARNVSNISRAPHTISSSPARKSARVPAKKGGRTARHPGTGTTEPRSRRPPVRLGTASPSGFGSPGLAIFYPTRAWTGTAWPLVRTTVRPLGPHTFRLRTATGFGPRSNAIPFPAGYSCVLDQTVPARPSSRTAGTARSTKSLREAGKAAGTRRAYPGTQSRGGSHDATDSAIPSPVRADGTGGGGLPAGGAARGGDGTAGGQREPADRKGDPRLRPVHGADRSGPDG